MRQNRVIIKFGAILLVCLMLGTMAFSSCGTLTSLSCSPATPPVTKQPSEIKEGLAILSHSSYVDNFGYFHLVGEVENIGSQNTELNEITVTFFDNEGSVVVTASNHTYLEILRPGQTSPFEIILISPPTEENYKLETGWQVTESSTYTAFEFTNVAAEFDEEGQYRLFGTIKNAGVETVTVVAIIGSFYDNSKMVVAAGFTFPNELPLGIGENSPFMMILDHEAGQRVKIYYLQAEGY